MIRTYLILAALAPVLLLGYANCGEFKASDKLVSTLSSQCVAKVRAAPVSFSASVCDDMSSFKCDRRVFKPGLVAEPSMKTECVSADSCVVVTTYSYNTEGARDGAAAGAFDDGGEYNREEVQCTNSSLMSESISLIASDAKTLNEALPSAVAQCRAKGQVK